MAKKKKRRAPRRVQQPEVPRVPTRSRLLVALLILSAGIITAAVLGLTRGGDGGDGRAVADLLEPEDPGPVHVHGLGVNPADNALFLATHSGTYRVAPDAQQPVRVGDSRQDTMGFTIVGPNRFLGSGHPDPETMREENLPPNLGLVESTDAGRTWTPVSLLGQADFHVLRSRGALVYGFDATNDRLLVSRDRGRTWSRRPAPRPLIDLVVHPQRPGHLVAATGRGLSTSANGGRTWRALSDRVGLLAWPAAARLLVVDGAGRVHVSRDSGGDWAPLGGVGGQPAAFVAESAHELYVALHDGTVKRSTDGGRSWTVRARP